jgi:hypothetical protein
VGDETVDKCYMHPISCQNRLEKKSRKNLQNCQTNLVLKNKKNSAIFYVVKTGPNMSPSPNRPPYPSGILKKRFNKEKKIPKSWELKYLVSFQISVRKLENKTTKIQYHLSL